MSGIVMMIIAIVVLGGAYLLYGRYLQNKWGIDPKAKTPAYEMEDGVDYVPADTNVVFGHQFASIAGAGPINGPIQAAIFGWLPVMLWILIGGVFFGAVQDFASMYASVKNKGRTIGYIIEAYIGKLGKKLFLLFCWLFCILVVAAFADVVAGTFNGFATSDAGVVTKVAANGAVATTSMLFILEAVVLGFFLKYTKFNKWINTAVAILLLVLAIALGLKFPVYVSLGTWHIIIFAYILVASVAPVWALLQPRDYLSSFLLYAMMVIAAVGVIGAGLTGADAAHMDMPAFTGAYDTIAPTGTSLGYVFPALFVTIACGAISGFHSLVGSGTTAKQLDHERDAKPIAYGGMLIECALALISLSAVSFIWNEYASGEIVTPTQVFATGISRMVASIPGLAGAQSTISSLLVLTVSVFCLTSLDTATRLARYMFQEFWLKPGEKAGDPTVTGARKVLCNPYVSTAITVVLGIALGMTGYAKIWPLFGAANQLLAALALLTVCAWLGNIGRNNKMFYFPMIFMILVTLTSLVFTIKSQITAIIAGSTGVAWCYIRAILAILLVILAIDLVVEGSKALAAQAKAKKAA